MIWCPSCGKHTVPDDEGFCPCGEPVGNES